jgi:O-antigen/teichoic acid export membrane protein
VVVAYPALAVAWVQDRDRFHRTLATLRDLLLLVGLPVLFVPIVWGEKLLQLGFGREYAVGAGALQILMVGSFFAFQSLMLMHAAQASGQERALVRVLGLTVGLKVTLNGVLVPLWGYLGTAVAAAATEVGYFALLAALARSTDPGRARPVGAGAMAGVAVLAISALLIASGSTTWGVVLFTGMWVLLAGWLGPTCVRALRGG